MSWSLEVVKPTYSCNKQVLKFFREQLNWTQAKLGQVSGYSERLVSKAESGKSISSETIADLADALSTPLRKVHPEDLICDPVEFAKQYISALYLHQKRMLSVIEFFIDPEIEFRVNGDPGIIPFAGVHHGIDQLRRMCEIFFAVIEVPLGHDHKPHYQFYGQGNDVVVWGESWMHPIGRPLKKPMQICNLMRFRCGKLIYLEDRFDTKLAEQTISEFRAVP